MVPCWVPLKSQHFGSAVIPKKYIEIHRNSSWIWLVPRFNPCNLTQVQRLHLRTKKVHAETQQFRGIEVWCLHTLQCYKKLVRSVAAFTTRKASFQVCNNNREIWGNVEYTIYNIQIHANPSKHIKMYQNLCTLAKAAFPESFSNMYKWWPTSSKGEITSAVLHLAKNSQHQWQHSKSAKLHIFLVSVSSRRAPWQKWLDRNWTFQHLSTIQLRINAIIYRIQDIVSHMAGTCHSARGYVTMNWNCKSFCAHISAYPWCVNSVLGNQLSSHTFGSIFVAEILRR